MQYTICLVIEKRKRKKENKAKKEKQINSNCLFLFLYYIIVFISYLHLVHHIVVNQNKPERENVVEK